MAVTTTKTNKPINPRGNDQSPKGYNRASLFSGKALDFDGVNDYVDLDGFTLSGTTATFSFAFNSDELSVLRYFFDASDTRFIIGSGNTANYLTLYTPTSSFQDIVEVQTGEWYKLDISINGTSAACYLNGQLVNTLTIGEIDLSAATLAKFGSARNGAGLFYNGKASNFKIFNTALTAAQVSDLYNNPEKIVPTGVEDTALKLWLPMMEGAGTTAYDGSGNGNHGTISGSTWTHGIGSPVAQTAVIDWNKGTNLLKYSEELDRGSYWATTATIVTANDTTAPDGQETADLLKETTTSAPHYINIGVTTAASTTYVQSAWVKKKDDGIYAGVRTNGVGGNSYIIFDFDTATIVATGSDIISSGVEAYSNGWYRIYMTYTLAPTGAIYSVTNSSSSVIPSYTGTGKGYYIWGAQLEAADALTAYIPNHTDSAITSPVLLPQGLTSGRDITGVNLFENVRKQGALNLDGNSWAEVHDNASLDFTSGMSLEAWVQIDDADGINQHILGKWNSGASKKEYLMYYGHGANEVQFYFGHGATVQSASFPITATGQWFHFVGTTDGTTITPYVNGVAGTTAAQTTALAASDIDVTIGTDDSKGSNAVQKQLAQPRIYNRALTAEEVQRNYDAGKNIYTNS